MSNAQIRLGLLAAAFAAAAALGVAFASEWWGGLVPCALCLVERWPYRIAIAIGLLACLLPGRLPRLGFVLLLLAGLASVAAAGTHVGVEWGLWPSPLPECAAPRFAQGSVADRLRSMPDRPAKPCEDPVYILDGVPVSFAELGLLYALAYTAGVASLLVRSGRIRR